MIKLPPDITFVIQLVAFVVFWQLMRVLIFSPMQEALKVRAQKTGGARDRAEALIAEAAQVDASIEAGLADARKEGALRADEIRKRSEAEEHAILPFYYHKLFCLNEYLSLKYHFFLIFVNFHI